MIRTLPSIIRQLCFFVFIVIAAGRVETVNAQSLTFPYADSFKNSTAPGMQLGGTPNSAILTGDGVAHNGITDVDGAGYLRLTNNSTNQAGYAYNTAVFPSDKGLSISFEYYTHGGTADGISFFLFDANVVNLPAEGTGVPATGGYVPGFNIGGFGGSLGYAQRVASPADALPGLRGGYLGIGLDEFGNFATTLQGRQGGTGTTPLSNAVTLRGDGNGNGPGTGSPVGNNYEILTTLRTSVTGTPSTFNIAGGVNGRTGGPGGLLPTAIGYRKAKIDLEPISGGYKVNVYITEGQPLPGGPILHHVITDYNYTTGTLPPFLSYGFAASTGGSVNYHEIRTIDIVVPASVIAPPVVEFDQKITTQGVPAVLNVLTNDHDPNGNLTIRENSVDLDPNTPGEQKIFNVPGQGTFTENGTGIVTFTPDPSFVGIATIPYSIKDNGNAESIVNLSATNPPPPALATTATTIQISVSGPPSITTVNSNPVAVCFSATSTNTAITYSAVTGSPNQYRIHFDSGIPDVTLRSLPASPIPLALPAGLAPGTYTGTLYVTNTIGGTTTESAGTAISIKVNPVPVKPTITADGAPITFCAGGSVILISSAGSGNQWYLNGTPIAAPAGTAATYTATASGNYTVIVTTSGCSSPVSDPITVTVQAGTPQPSVISGLAAACTGTPITYSVTNVAGATYAWTYSGTGYTITGNGTNSITILFATGATAGTLSVTATNPSSCVSPAQTKAITIGGPCNVPPTAVPDSYTVSRGGTLTVPAATGVLANDTDPDAGTVLTATKMTDPAHGTVTQNSNGSFTYVHDGSLTPTSDSYTYKVNDGTVDGNTVTVTITIVNHEPAGTNKAVTTPEDTPYTFAAADFGFTDPNDDPANAFLAVKITTIPGTGTLSLSGTPVTAGQVIPAASIPNLVFTPVANGNGSPYASFTFQVQDNGGTANGSIDLDASPNTITINVTAVNDPPVVADITKASTGYNPIPFTVADFTSKFTDVDGDALTKVKIISLPPNGTLKLSGVNVTAGQEIPVDQLVNLTFTPTPFFSGLITFPWNGNDGALYAVSNANVNITITLPPDPAKIGVAKRVAAITNGISGSYDVKFVFTVTNYGPNALDNISLLDNLATAFAGTDFTVKSVNNSGNLRVNPAYNGVAITELLLPASKLLAGETATVDLTINVRLILKEGTFLNTALVTGSSTVNGLKVTDKSTDGLKPDPTTAGDVTPAVDTPVPLAFKPIYIPGGFSPNGDGINDVFVIQNVLNKSVHLEVYNRWANLVYKSDPYKNNWDGKCTVGAGAGTEVPDGTYYYIVIIDNKDKYQGYITINR